MKKILLAVLCLFLSSCGPIYDYESMRVGMVMPMWGRADCIKARGSQAVFRLRKSIDEYIFIATQRDTIVFITNEEHDLFYW